MPAYPGCTGKEVVKWVMLLLFLRKVSRVTERKSGLCKHMTLNPNNSLTKKKTKKMRGNWLNRFTWKTAMKTEMAIMTLLRRLNH